MKHDTGKPQMSLVPPKALLEVGKAMTFGAKKYSKHSYMQGMEHGRLLDAIMRHLLAYTSGEDLDQESGLSHITHIAGGAMILEEYRQRGIGTDDRYKEEIVDEKVSGYIDHRVVDKWTFRESAVRSTGN